MNESGRQPVTEVQRLVLSVLRSNPPRLVVSAHGLVPSTGWGHPILLPREGAEAGVLELDFLVAPQRVTVVDVKLPVHAAYVHEGELAEVREVRVHGAGGACSELTSRARELAPADAKAALDGGEPQRSISLLGLPQNVRDLVGFKLRVLGPGDRPTSERDPLRVSIHVDAERVITDITVG